MSGTYAGRRAHACSTERRASRLLGSHRQDPLGASSASRSPRRGTPSVSPPLSRSGSSSLSGQSKYMSSKFHEVGPRPKRDDTPPRPRRARLSERGVAARAFELTARRLGESEWQLTSASGG